MENDTKIFEDVNSKLEFTPGLDSSSISVGVKDAIVTLSGTVSRYGQKHLAEESVKGVKGVRGVVDQLQVQLPGRVSDQDLAHSISNALRWNSFVPSEKIKVVIDQGFVELSGEVNSMFEKEQALSSIRYLQGIKEISNQIVVRPTVRASNVKEQITREFERNALLDATKVQVEVTGNQVMLKGRVRSWAEFAEASTAAWSVPGVERVDNLLQVMPY